MNDDFKRDLEHRLTRVEILIGVLVAQTLATWAGVGPDAAQAAINLIK